MEATLNKFGAYDLHFNGRPEASTLKYLKENGFRYFAKTQVWSAFKKEEEIHAILEFLNNGVVVDASKVEKVEKYAFKSLVEVLEEDERNKIIDSFYGRDGYVQQTKERDYKHYKDYFLEGYRVFKTQDGLEFAIETRKPSIERTMYYDDEHEAPSKSYESWERYNLFYNFKERTDYDGNVIPKFTKEHCIYKNKEYGFLSIIPEGYEYFTDEKVRRLTQEEIDDLNAMVQEQREKYIKRLKAYYKKYSDKITTYGYWANR